MTFWLLVIAGDMPDLSEQKEALLGFPASTKVADRESLSELERKQTAIT
jgi:hypothetical protein